MRNYHGGFTEDHGGPIRITQPLDDGIDPYKTSCDAIELFKNYTFKGINLESLYSRADVPYPIRSMFKEIDFLYDRFYDFHPIYPPKE